MSDRPEISLPSSGPHPWPDEVSDPTARPATADDLRRIARGLRDLRRYDWWPDNPKSDADVVEALADRLPDMLAVIDAARQHRRGQTLRDCTALDRAVRAYEHHDSTDQDPTTKGETE